MKKIIIFALATLFAFSVQCKKKQDTVSRQGLVNALAGTVTIIDGDKRKPAAVGDAVKPGMSIETGERSFVDIFFDQNAVKILEKTTVTISRLETSVLDGAETSAFVVKKGRMFSKVVKKLAKGDRYTVSTPTSTAGVRGTEFLVESEELKSLIACLNGEVEVKREDAPAGKEEQVVVEAEQQVVVEKDKPMTVEELSADNRKLIEDIKKNFQDAKREIREIFEKQREEIRRTVEEQKQKNKEMIEQQKELDRKNIEQQKETDRENIDRIRGTSRETKSEADEAVRRQKGEAEKSLQEVKPEIPKFKSTIE